MDFVDGHEADPFLALGVAGGDGGVEVFREAVEGDDVVAGGDEFLFEPEFFLEVLDLGEEADDFMGDGAEGLQPGAEGGPRGFRGLSSRSSRWTTSFLMKKSSSRRRKPPRSLWTK